MMNPHFFVFCLPRSRSAWLSNFLTYESVFCMHEPLPECRTIEDLEAKLVTTGTPIAGAADTGAMFWVDEIIEHFPSARFVVLARDPAGFVEQTRRMGATENDAIAMLEQFETTIGTLHKLGKRTLTVASKQLDDYDVANKVWRHVGMPIDMHRLRYEQLRDTRVEVIMDRARDRVLRNADNIKALAGG